MRWIAIWLAIALAGAVLLSKFELNRLRENFEVDARIMHRLLSQRASQHDAVLATLSLLQAQNRNESSSESSSKNSDQRLSSVYPQIISIDKRLPGSAWSDKTAGSALDSAEKVSRDGTIPALAAGEFHLGRFWLVLASTPDSYALHIDNRAMVPWSKWPFENRGRDSSVRVVLEHGAQAWELQPGRLADSTWRFDFRKHLASPSQPFDVVVTRSLGWAELPWMKMVSWVLGSALVAAAVAASLHQRRERARAQEWLRLGNCDGY